MISYLFKIKLLFQVLGSKKGIALYPVVITLPFVANTPQMAMLFLIGLMILDFITGIKASISRRKKEIIVSPELANKRIVSSEKLKKSGEKFLLYASSIIVSIFLESIFHLKGFMLPISHLTFTLSVGVTLFWCLVEIYSIFFENFFDMGYDIKQLVSKISNTISSFKQTKNEINN